MRRRISWWLASLGTSLVAAPAVAEETGFETDPAPIERDAPSRDTGMQSGVAFGLGIGMMTVGAAGMTASLLVYDAKGGVCDDARVRARALEATRHDLDACVEATNQQVGAVVGMVTSGALFLFAVPITIVGGSSAGEPSVASPPEPEVTALVGPTRASVVVAF